jgi:excisionase family DNA binding protein
MASHPEASVYVEHPTPLLDLNGVARRLSVSRPTIYRMLERGDLVAYRVNERLRFKVEDVEAYLDRRREPV